MSLNTQNFFLLTHHLSMQGDARDLAREARYELVEAYRASRMLKIHAIIPILAMIITAIIQAALIIPLYNPLAISQVNPTRRIEFIASSLADFVAYTGIATSIFLLLTWLFMGFAVIHISRLAKSKWEPLGLVIVVTTAISSILLGYNAIVAKEAVYKTSLKVLSKPEIASIIANMGVHLSEEELKAYTKALAETLASVQSLDTGFVATAITLILSVTPPLLAILAFEPIARKVESKWPRILQILLVLMVLQTIIPKIPLPSTAIAGIVLSLVNILEPIAAWLTANRVKRYVEERLLETQ